MLTPGSKVFEEARAAERARRLFAEADDVPALIERLGGRLAKRVRERLVARLSSDPTVQESIRREAEMLRRELEGDNPTVIERLVVERIVIAWLGVSWADLLQDGFASDLAEREVAAHVMRLRNAANRNYLYSLKSLALIRKAAPLVVVNVSGRARQKDQSHSV